MRKGQRKQECARGHQITEENVYIQPKTGKRTCKFCRDERNLFRYKPNPYVAIADQAQAAKDKADLELYRLGRTMFKGSPSLALAVSEEVYRAIGFFSASQETVDGETRDIKYWTEQAIKLFLEIKNVHI